MKLVKKLLPLCVLVLALGVDPAHAASLLVDANGILTGATGVMVNGTSYDVSFQAGSCNSVLNGCDPTEDLFFTSDLLALAASQALLDQVFIGTNPGNIDPMSPGLFDDHPGLIGGCTEGAFRECTALTPYGFSGGAQLLVGFATNYGAFFDGSALIDYASLGSIVGGGTPTLGIQTFAVWSASPVTPTPVPEPSTVVLLGSGLIAAMRPLSRRAQRLFRTQ
jgi:hypothetical protein